MSAGLLPLPFMHPVAGVRLGVTSAGIKKAGRQDLVVFALDEGTTVAGVYTQNAFCAAPVTIARQHNELAPTRCFLVNTGNANAGTGDAGMQAAIHCCQSLAEQLSLPVESILPFSTGVIGEPLPADKIVSAIPEACAKLSSEGWTEAATGILTTDTGPKGASVQLELAGSEVTITGISKGAGMIRPNMATMLGFIATDAQISAELLQTMLKEAVEFSFNRVTIDGDTSTNDCCMLAATGASGVAIAALPASEKARFTSALNRIFISLAQAIVRDGEGATKFVSVNVKQAATTSEALKVAYTIAESPLVKTALFASDPNWGRILACVGRVGITDLDIRRVNIYLGEVCIVSGGEKASAYTEAAGAAVMAEEEITIRVELGRGDVTETVWTTDFSYDYVRINAEYRT